MKKKSVANPHDTFFRHVFARPAVAAEFLRLYLPPELARQLDLRTVECDNGSFVDAHLREHYSDLLLRVRFKTGDAALVYFLLEHKSAPDARVPLQLLRYLTQAWEGMPPPLPLIVPVVLYHGAQPWPDGRRLRDLFGARALAWQRFLPDFEFYLCDLSQYADRRLKGRAGLAPVLKLLKYIFRRELPAKLPGVFLQTVEALPEVEAQKLMRTMLRYLEATRRVTDAQISAALQQGDKMETILDKWEKEWRQQGLQQGLQQGREEGREEGQQVAADLALRMARLQFGALERTTSARIRALPLAALTHLGKLLPGFQTTAELETWLQTQTTVSMPAPRRRARA